MRLRRYRPVALLLLALHMASCKTSWQPIAVSPPQIIADEQPSQVRITLLDGERLTARDPSVRADSLVWVETIRWSDTLRSADGLLLPQPQRGHPLSRFRTLALSDIRQIEVRRISISAARTVGLTFLALLVWYVAACEA